MKANCKKGKPPSYSESPQAEVNGVLISALSTLPSQSLNAIIPASIEENFAQSDVKIYPPEKTKSSKEELAVDAVVTK
jgi:hypothetical protein